MKKFFTPFPLASYKIQLVGISLMFLAMLSGCNNEQSFSQFPIELTSDQPKQGFQGTLITLNGAYFDSRVTATLDGIPCLSLSVLNSNTLICKAPDHAIGPVDVVVQQQSGSKATLPRGFLYVDPLTLLTITPNIGPAATPVTIKGKGFGLGATVTLDNIPCLDIAYVDTYTLTCVTPPHANGSVDVTVINPGLESVTLKAGYTYTPVVCDPFNQTSGSATVATNGLQATLTYLPIGSETVNQHASSLLTGSFAPGQPDVQLEPALFFLNNLYVPTENFTDGFSDGGGNALRDLSGQVLTQYFALHIDANIQLNSSDVEGYYQFAVLADDGAIMTLSPTGLGGTMQSWVNVDGIHGNNLGCALKTVKLAHGKPIPIHIDYFQGPPESIALVLVWRLNPSAALLANDPPCNFLMADNYYFDPSASPPTPLAPWIKLTSNPLTNNPPAGTGWQVVPATNFYLQNGIVNPCVNNSAISR